MAGQSGELFGPGSPGRLAGGNGEVFRAALRQMNATWREELPHHVGSRSAFNSTTALKEDGTWGEPPGPPRCAGDQGHLRFWERKHTGSERWFLLIIGLWRGSANVEREAGQLLRPPCVPCSLASKALCREAASSTLLGRRQKSLLQCPQVLCRHRSPFPPTLSPLNQ